MARSIDANFSSYVEAAIAKKQELKNEVNNELTGAVWHRAGVSKTSGKPYDFHSGFITIGGKKYKLSLNAVEHKEGSKLPSFRVQLGEELVPTTDSGEAVA